MFLIQYYAMAVRELYIKTLAWCLRAFRRGRILFRRYLIITVYVIRKMLLPLVMRTLKKIGRAVKPYLRPLLQKAKISLKKISRLLRYVYWISLLAIVWCFRKLYLSVRFVYRKTLEPFRDRLVK